LRGFALLAVAGFGGLCGLARLFLGRLALAVGFQAETTE